MNDKIIISKERAAAFKAILENIEKYGANFQEARDKIDKLQSELTSVKEELERLERFLHAKEMHPDYEYTYTEGPRKCWGDEDVPPEGEGWERNIARGREGWERFDYAEESYWRRKKTQAQEGEG